MLWDVRTHMKPALQVIDLIPSGYRMPALATLHPAVPDGRVRPAAPVRRGSRPGLSRGAFATDLTHQGAYPEREKLALRVRALRSS